MSQVVSESVPSVKKNIDFRLPICFVEHKELSNDLINDLELLRFKDNDSSGFYDAIFEPKTEYGKKTALEWCKYYTNDKVFLKDSQYLHKNYDSSMNIYDKNKLENIDTIWLDIKSDDNFINKFHYVEYEFAQQLNESAPFLQILTMYNLLSPVFSILLPIIFLIMPFIILQLQGITISLSKYFEVLKTVVGRHAIGQLFTLTSEISWEKRFYVLISIGFYVFQIYQNAMCCVSFYKRMRLMHEYIFNIKDYIDYSVEKMDEFLIVSSGLKSYHEFNNSIKKHKKNLIDLKGNINNITPFSHSLNKLLQIGSTMQIFYVLHKNDDYNHAMNFSMSFIGYIDNISSINRMHQEGKLNCCVFGDKTTKFKDAYYPLVEGKPVKNTYSLKKNIVITGPNAAGKTTMLKTTTVNIILSQQIGSGFYKRCTITPFSYIHCYVNIPDTSGRDSLFQAEARRCKEILDKIMEADKNERHFCIFDELYSGTNPYEAVASSYSFLEYLTKQKNTEFMLTTHFIDLCEKLENNYRIKNCHMEIETKNNELKYKYKIRRGISDVKGGIKILENLNYPEYIIRRANQALKS